MLLQVDWAQASTRYKTWWVAASKHTLVCTTYERAAAVVELAEGRPRVMWSVGRLCCQVPMLAPKKCLCVQASSPVLRLVVLLADGAVVTMTDYASASFEAGQYY